jgi:hypothetical protein
MLPLSYLRVAGPCDPGTHLMPVDKLERRLYSTSYTLYHYAILLPIRKEMKTRTLYLTLWILWKTP